MKPEHTINCPNCQHSFPIEAAFTTQLRAKIDAEIRLTYDSRLAKERDALTRELTRTAQAEASRVNAGRLAELEAAATERETAVKRLQTQLETTRREAAQRARDEFTAERKGLEEELGRQRTALADLRRNEIALRQEKTRLEGVRQELEVQSARQIDAERDRLRAELTRKIDTERVRVREELASAHSEAQRLKEAEYAQQTQTLRKQVDELRRKLEAGGEQRRGEVCEVRLEEFLRVTHPSDTIEPVAPGANGADVCQRVCAPGMPVCGTIIYENKHTAAWNQGWIAKLKEDQRAERAEAAVLVSTALPKGLSTFMMIDGVWVTSYNCLPGLSHALRITMLQVAASRQAAIGRGEKTEMLYTYVTGSEFKQSVEAMFEIIGCLDQDFIKEKRAVTMAWKRREKQLEAFGELRDRVFRQLARHRWRRRAADDLRPRTHRLAGNLQGQQG